MSEGHGERDSTCYGERKERQLPKALYELIETRLQRGRRVRLLVLTFCSPMQLTACRKTANTEPSPDSYVVTSTQKHTVDQFDIVHHKLSQFDKRNLLFPNLPCICSHYSTPTPNTKHQITPLSPSTPHHSLKQARKTKVQSLNFPNAHLTLPYLPY